MNASGGAPFPVAALAEVRIRWSLPSATDPVVESNIWRIDQLNAEAHVLRTGPRAGDSVINFERRFDDGDGVACPIFAVIQFASRAVPEEAPAAEGFVVPEGASVCVRDAESIGGAGGVGDARSVCGVGPGVDFLAVVRRTDERREDSRCQRRVA